MGNFKPKCSSSGIGSIPHRRYKKVLDDILRDFDFPYWPQLCNRGFAENMYVQYAEKIPSLNIDFDKENLFFNTKDISSLEKFYEKVIVEDCDYFKISKKYAHGFYEFLKKAKKLDYVKGQTTGPISFGYMIRDQNKKSILYNQDFFEAVVEGLAMKARWQIRELKKKAKKVIMFFDEPSMCLYGSVYLSLEKKEVLEALNKVIDAAKQEGAIVGVHCCGNTDWGLMMETNTDIISFDAYNYSDKLLLYTEDVKKFLKKGCLAWGIVPTSNDIINEDEESLVNKLEDKIQELVDKGIDKNLILEKAMITPSCGTGSLYNKAADKVLKTTSEVSKKMKEKYF